MTSPAPDIRSLSRAAPAAPIPRPRIRWGTRVFLPLAILLATAALIAYAARAALIPSIGVHVVPVMPASAESAEPGESTSAPSGPAAVIVQAPGWIEPDPYAVTVQALADGVVKEILVLEGQTVQADQVVARMIEADARLNVRLTEAELEGEQARLERARAQLKAAEARADEVRDEVNRKRPLLAAGGISEGQLARLELRLAAAEREVEAFRAEITETEASVKRHRVVCDEARLRFSRMEIRSPIAGVVMERLIEPGARVSMNAPPGEKSSMGIVRLYDPSRLQVRVDVPIADAAKIHMGSRAEVVTEALPDLALEGEVIRIVHAADIQRNTVQFKVGVKDPGKAGGVLKPEMLMRVRFLGAPATASPHAGMDHAISSIVLAPASLLRDESDGKARLWILDRSRGIAGPVASSRAVSLGRRLPDGSVQVLEGLNPGDRLIADSFDQLREGARVTVLGEAQETSP